MGSSRSIATCGLFALALSIGGCSIDGSRALGEDCLQNRECVTGLSCQPRSDGRYVCQPITEASTFVTDASATDAGADGATDVTIPVDTGTE